MITERFGLAASIRVGEQPADRSGELGAHHGLLVTDRDCCSTGEGDEVLAVGLAGVIAQAWPADAVVEDRVERKAAGVTGSQSGLHEHDHEVTHGRFQEGEVGFLFELGHDELRNEAGQRLVAPGQVVLVDGCVGRDVR